MLISLTEMSRLHCLCWYLSVCPRDWKTETEGLREWTLQQQTWVQQVFVYLFNDFSHLFARSTRWVSFALLVPFHWIRCTQLNADDVFQRKQKANTIWTQFVHLCLLVWEAEGMENIKVPWLCSEVMTDRQTQATLQAFYYPCHNPVMHMRQKKWSKWNQTGL